MTPKFKATALTFGRYQTFPIVDDHGRRFRRARPQELSTGDKVFLGKRINNHHGSLAEWELWEIVVEADPRWPNCPKTWYGKTRYLFVLE